MKNSLRNEILKFVKQKYKISGDYPWVKYPEIVVLRHPDNKKWFGLIMAASYDKLGLNGTESVDVLNVKKDPLIIGGFIKNKGILPAYHMNKSSWASVLLDGSVSMKDIEFLLHVSFELTKTTSKGK